MSTRIGRKRNSRVKRRRIGATLRSDEDESLDSAAAEAPKVALTSQTPTNRRTRGKRIDFSAAFESDSDAEMVENECISDESFTGVRHDQERGLGELRSGKIIGMDGTSLTTARRVEPRMVSEPSKLKRLPSSETIQDHVPILDTPLEAKNAGKSGTSSDSRKISTEIPSTESSVNQTDVKMPGRQIKELNRADLITDLNELKTGMMIPLKHHLPVDATAAQITVSKITGTDANEVGNHCQIPPLSPGGTETLSRDIDEDRGSDDDTISPNESVTIVNPEARTVSKGKLYPFSPRSCSDPDLILFRRKFEGSRRAEQNLGFLSSSSLERVIAEPRGLVIKQKRLLQRTGTFGLPHEGWGK